MADTLTLELVTPLGSQKGEGILEINLPAETGEMGILPGHDVMVLSLGTGPVYVQYPDRKDVFFASRGYIQIDKNNVRILAEVCESKDKIDLDRAKEALDRADKRLKENAEKLDWTRAEAALKRAVQRIDIASMG